MPTAPSVPKGGAPAEAPSSRSGSGSSEGAAPAALVPGPRERRHIEHLISQSVDSHGEPEPEPGPETERVPEPGTSQPAPPSAAAAGSREQPEPEPQATAEEGVPGEKEMMNVILSGMMGLSEQAMFHMRGLAGSSSSRRWPR